MISRRERRLIASLSHQPLDRLEETCRSDKHREKFAQLNDDSFDTLIRKEYPRFLALKTFCRDYTHPRFVAPSQLIGTIWKIHVIDEDDYELVCRSVHNGRMCGDTDSTPVSDDEDVENPGKFRLILYPQPEHRSEENKWTKKALAMTRRLYRLYFNEPPPMDIWGDERPALIAQQNASGMALHLNRRSSSPHLDLNNSRLRDRHLESEPRPTAPQQFSQASSSSVIPQQSSHVENNSARKHHTLIKREILDDNSPLVNSRNVSSNSSRRRNSPSRGHPSSTPVRRVTVSGSADIPASRGQNFFPQQVSPPSTSSSGGRRAPHSSGATKRPHASHQERSAQPWPSPVSHYSLYRPALRRRRISHEGLLLIVPIHPAGTVVPTAGQPSTSKLPGHQPIRGSAESYGVDSPFQVYMSVFDTVRQLKEKIWSEKGVPVNRQVIWISDNAVLNEGQKLGDLGVAVGDLDDGLGSNTEGKDVIGLQVIKDIKSEPEDKSVKKPESPVVGPNVDNGKTA